MMHTAWWGIWEVSYCFSMSSVKFQGNTGQKNRQLWPELGVSGLNLQFGFTDGYEMMRRAWSSIEKVPHCFFKFIRHISRSRATETIFTRTWRFRTVTWIAQSLTLHGIGVLLFFKVIRQIPRSHEAKINDLTRIGRFWTFTQVRIHQWLWNVAQNLKRNV